MKTYKQLKKQHQEEINEFPLFFAFNRRQFIDGKKSLGVWYDKDLLRLEGTGGYMRKKDEKAWDDMIARHKKEMQELKEDNKTFKEMIKYELMNHEAGYTCSYEDALDALNINFEELSKDKQKVVLDELTEQIQGSC